MKRRQIRTIPISRVYQGYWATKWEGFEKARIREIRLENKKDGTQEKFMQKKVILEVLQMLMMCAEYMCFLTNMIMCFLSEVLKNFTLK